MAWDITQPTNTTKIRNLGVVIRPNWQAIQEGDATFKPNAINLANRTALPISANPAAIANSYITYAKQDATGAVELFGISPLSTVTQFTKGSPVASGNGSTFLPGGIILKWGQFNYSGTSHTENFISAFPTASLNVLICPLNQPAASTSFWVVSHNTTSLTMQVTSSTNNISFIYWAVGH